MSRKRIWIAAAVALAAGSVAVISLAGTPSHEARADGGGIAPLPVEVTAVAHEPGYTVLEHFAGRVVARRTSELGFERSGTLVRVVYDEGQRVEAGDVLAELDSRSLRAQRAEIDAQLAEIRSELELAGRTSERRRKLHASEHLSEQHLDEALYAERALGARRDAIRAAGERIDVALELSRITAPYAGRIEARHVDEGTVVAPGQPIVQLLEDRALEARVGVPPATAAALEVGSRRRLEVEGREVEAVLEAVLESVAPDTRTLTAIFRIPDLPAGGLRVHPGSLVRVALPRAIDSAGFWLPISALAESHRGLWSAYVVAADSGGQSVLERRQLEVLHAESDRAFVRGTLRDGETVVADGLHRLVPGLAVQIAPPAAPLANAATVAATP